MSKKLNIVVPMAGRGSRFAGAGYEKPKPMIDVLGFPMIQYVIGNLRPSTPHRFIFIVLAEHIDRYQVDRSLTQLAPGAIVIPLDGVTEGAACTVLTAKDYIYNIGTEYQGMYGLGTPEDLEKFLSFEIAQKARAQAARVLGV